MRLSAGTLDDLVRKLFPKLLSSTNHISPSRGHARELVGVLLELQHPRARLSRTETRGKPFSCLGEFLWYMTRGNKLDFIRYYIPAYEEETEDGETIYGAYGRRLFSQRGQNQLRNAIDALGVSPESRRAVIQLFNAEDIARRHKEVPCTCTLQFLVRRKRLHLLTTMRSNDAYKGLPHDIFCFTMLQEVMARTLGVELGTYKQFVGSLHLYDEDRGVAEQYLNEAVQSTILMPPMPIGDPWLSLRKLLDAEDRIRHGGEFDADAWGVDPYWADLIRLLQIFAATGDTNKIEAFKAKMVFDRYAPYIDSRKVMKPRVIPPLQQLVLPL
jgi:thymidylate synthase